MLNQKTIITGLLVLTGITTYFVFIPKKTLRNSAETLVVGTAAGYAPFVSINAQGEYEGFDIDVAHALAKQMDKKLEIKDLGSMVSLFVSLEQGSIDAIIWGLSITQDRLKKVAMVHYQGAPDRSYPLLFWKQIPAGIRGFEDMQGQIISIEPGSSQESVLNKYPQVYALPVEKIDDALLNIQYGKSSAALVEPAIALKFKNKFSEIQILEIPLATEDQVQGIGIAIKQSNTALITTIQKAVEALKTSGTIKTLEDTWGLS